MSLTRCLAELDLEGDQAPPRLGWLRESWEDPETFWAWLRGERGTVSPPGKSRRGGAVEPWSELLGRHGHRKGPAWQDERGTLSYRALAAEASALAAAWRQAGVQPGATVALVGETPRVLLVAALACLRLGAPFCLVEPRGPAWVQRRLDGLPAGHVAAEGGATGDLDLQARGRGDQPPATFAPGQPACFSYSPMRDGGPWPVTAEQLVFGAWRDAVFAWRLGAGSTVAAPGLGIEHGQPVAWFAALLAGATWVELPWSSDTELASALASRELDVLHVDRACRDAVLERGKGLKAKSWLRDPGEELDWDAWRAFAQRAGKAPSGNVLLDPASGGAVLFSARRRGVWAINQHVLPVPGEPWRVADVVAPSQDSVRSSGLLRGDGDVALAGDIVLAERGTERFFAGTLQPRRGGLAYPHADVEAVATAVPGVAAACSLPVVGCEHAYQARFVLLLFVRGDEDLGPAVAARVARALGERAAPDVVRSYRWSPRLLDGELDRAWCESQFLTGALHRKASSPVFRALQRLRESMG